jgi:hypothetical protein
MFSRMSLAAPRTRAIAHLALLTGLWGASAARADTGPLDARARIAFGAGTHESSLPTSNGTEHVAAHAFSAWGFELRAAAPVTDKLRVGGVVSYATSLGYELTRPIFSGSVESSAARSQELGAHILAELGVGHYLVVPVMLGYTFSAFRTNLPLTAAASYLLSGPRLAAGLQLLLFDARLSLLALPEVGATLTTSDALRSAGLARRGLEYGWTAGIDVRLPYQLQIGVRYREARANLAADAAGSFRATERFMLGCVSWVNH